jgi:hypothetical protein
MLTKQAAGCAVDFHEDGYAIFTAQKTLLKDW